ncbi:MAG: hypothetical protein IT537_12285 [Hyphomicrobiales bacterium]|nr:hypothetical protein [Hyphomicrobiales bacterium]
MAAWLALTWLTTWLLVLQGFLSGVATVQAAALPPTSAIICHAADGTVPDGGVPSEGAAAHDCCPGCLTLLPALATPASSLLPARHRCVPAPVAFSFIVLIARGAVRAGASRAPPTLG